MSKDKCPICDGDHKQKDCPALRGVEKKKNDPPSRWN